MKTTLLLLVIFFANIFSQNSKLNNVPGFQYDYKYENGIIMVKTLTGNTSGNQANVKTPILYQGSNLAGSMVRWSYLDAIAIGDRNSTSGDGQYQAVGWGLNTERVSLFGNTNNTPLWEYPTSPNTNINYVSVSENSNYIVSGSYHNIYIFSRTSSTPVFDYNLETQLPDTGIAGPVDITSDGGFIVANASRNDSSWIMGFNRTSTTPVWMYRVGQTTAGGAGIQGTNISGSDSVVIVNTYGGFYVFRTYTGQLIYNGPINPTSSSGTQSPQGISGNGNFIATINYSGYLRVYQWNGSTYNFLWQHQEPPGAFYNWMTTVDISNDGNFIACGTLNFLTSNTYDGKVKMFRSTNSTPLWTYSGAGDEVTHVSFSKNGNILAASTWGDLGNSTPDLLVFKTSAGVNNPVYQLITPGSFFWCSASNNGNTVITSGKKVHARQFGNGGEVYNNFIDTNDSPLGIVKNNNIPTEFNLSQNYPNPFNPETGINFQLPVSSHVKITVYNVLGSKVETLIDNQLTPGNYGIQWDASNYSSGVYFYTMQTDGFNQTKKMALIK